MFMKFFTYLQKGDVNMFNLYTAGSMAFCKHGQVVNASDF